MKQENGFWEVRSLTRSFSCAFHGIRDSVVGGRNMRTHLTVACYVLVFSTFYGLSAAEYAVLLLTIGFVLAAETFNTAIEAVVNLAAPHYDPMARAAKDMAAGAVLIGALFAVGVGLCLFLRPAKMWAIWCFFTTHAGWSLVLLLSIPAALLFIFAFPRRRKVRRLHRVR